MDKNGGLGHWHSLNCLEQLWLLVMARSRDLLEEVGVLEGGSVWLRSCRLRLPPVTFLYYTENPTQHFGAYLFLLLTIRRRWVMLGINI